MDPRLTHRATRAVTSSPAHPTTRAIAILRFWLAATLALALSLLLGASAQAQCVPTLSGPTQVVVVNLDNLGSASVTMQNLGVAVANGCPVTSVTYSQNFLTCADLNAIVPVTVTVSNADGSDSYTVDVEAVDQDAPTITLPTTNSYACELPAALPDATVFDACGDAAAQASLTATSLTLASQAPGIDTYTRDWTADDGNGNTATVTETITVTDGQAPTITLAQNSAPLSQTVECGSGSFVAPTFVITDDCTASGNIATAITASSSQGTDPLAADFYNYDITYTLTATDALGNAATQDFFQLVRDTEGPVFTGLPTLPQTFPTNGNPTPCDGTASLDVSNNVGDACAAYSRLTFSYAITDDTPGTGVGPFAGNGLSFTQTLPAGSYTATFTAVDPSGNATSADVQIRVVDSAAPTFTCDPGVQTATVPFTGEFLLNPADYVSSLNDDCTPASQLTITATPDRFTCAEIGTQQAVTIEVTDASGNASDCQVTFDVVDGPPSVTCVDTVTAYLDAGGQATLLAQDLALTPLAQTDACGNPVFSVRKTGVAFSSSVALDCSDAPFTVGIVRVTSGTPSLFDECTSVIRVLDTIAPSVVCNDITRDLDAQGEYRFSTGDLAALGAGSSDNCGAQGLTYAVAPARITCAEIDAARLDSLGFDSVDVTLTVTDAAGNVSACDTFVVVRDVTRPQLSCVDRFISLGSGGLTTVTPEDFIAGEVYLRSRRGQGETSASFVTANAGDIDFDYDVTSADADLAFGYEVDGVATLLYDPANNGGSSSGSTTFNVNAGQTVRLFIDDDTVGGLTGEGGSVSISGLMTSLATNQVTTFAQPVRAAEITFGGAGTSYYVDNDCSGLEYEISVDGSPFAASQTVDCSGSSILSVEIRAIDVQNADRSTFLFSSCTTTLSLFDQQGPIVGCDAVTFDLGATSGTALVQASAFDNGSYDACGSIAEFIFTDNLGQPIGPDPTVMEVDCGDIGAPIAVNISAVDFAGNQGGSCPTTLTVVDNAGPAITVPSDVRISCEDPDGTASVNTGLATAVDACGGPVTIAEELIDITGTPSAITGDCQEFIRRFTATDASGNTSFAVQRISVFDNAAPRFSLITEPGYFPADTTVQCDSVFQNDPIGAFDNCTPSASVMVSVDTVDSRIDYLAMPPAFTFDEDDSEFYNYTIEREYTITDACGNSTQRLQTVTVEDTNAPVYTGTVPAFRVIENDPTLCGAFVEIDLTDSLADCAPFASLAVLNATSLGDGGAFARGFYPVSQPGDPNYEIAFTIDDPSVNSPATTLTFEFRVIDAEQPVAKCQDFTLTLPNSNVATITVADIDNNSTDNCSTMQLALDKSTFTCADLGPNLVTLTVTDGAGLQSSCTATVTVVPQTFPGFTQFPADVTVDCSADLSATAAGTGAAAADSQCGPATAVTFVDVVTAGNPNSGSREITRTFTATFASGNAVSRAQVITVEDNVDPVLTGVPAVGSRTILIDDCTVAAMPIIGVSDNCAFGFVDTVFAANTRSADSAACGFYTYTVTRTFVPRDGANTGSSATIVLDYRDDSAPVETVPDFALDTDPDACVATFSIDLGQYVADCADDRFLDFAYDLSGVTNVGLGNSAERIEGFLAPGTYTIPFTVTDPCGNATSGASFDIVVEDNQAPTAICNPIVTTLGSSGSVTVTAAAVNDNSFDNCPGSTLTYALVGQSTFTQPGTYNVTLEVSDGRNVGTCMGSVTVLAPLSVRASSATGPAGSTVTIDVVADNFTNVESLSGTVSLATAGVATFSAVTNVSPSFGANDFAFNVTNDELYFVYSGVSQSTITLPPSGSRLFTVELDLVGANGDATDLLLGDGSGGNGTQFYASQNFGGVLVQGTPQAGTPVGRVTIVGAGNQPRVEGTVHLVNPATAGVAGADVSFGGAVAADITDAAGVYGANVPAGSDVTVAPSKNNNYRDGVDFVDAADLQQHLLRGTTLQNPYQRIAADVDSDGIITASDLGDLQDLALFRTSSFPFAPSWRFSSDMQAPTLPTALDDVPAFAESMFFANVTADQLGIDFTGVKMGDLNYTATGAPLAGGTQPQRGAATMAFYVRDRDVAAGETVEVAFRTRELGAVKAYQTTLSLKRATAEAVRVGALDNLFDRNFYRADAYTVTHGWVNARGDAYAEETVAFTLTLTAEAAGRLSSMIELSGALTPTASFGTDGSRGGIDLVFDAVSGVGAGLEAGYALAQNRPNPFADATRIDFALPRAQTVRLVVVDATGRLVLARDIDGVAGRQTIELEAAQLGGAGVYQYTLITEGGAATRSLALTR